MLEVLEEPWVRTARAKGASEFRVIRAHALRNAIAPIVTMVAMDAGMAIGIAMYIETVFGLPGLGRTLIRALAGFQGYDLPVILAVTLVAATAIIVFNLVADIVLLAVDPTLARRTGRGCRASSAARRSVSAACASCSSPRCIPGPADPDLGVFVAQLEHALRERGHEIELAVLDRRGGGKLASSSSARRVRAAGARPTSCGRTSSCRPGSLALAVERAARRHGARPRRAQHRRDPRHRAR